jgi:DNA-binding response OmpR family regulator
MRKQLPFLLSEIEGAVVETAADGVEALRLFREFAPEVIILDIKMPRLNGIKVLQEIRRNDQSAIVIMFTADSSLETHVICLGSGANFFLDKVTELDRLLEICEREAFLRRDGE